MFLAFKYKNIINEFLTEAKKSGKGKKPSYIPSSKDIEDYKKLIRDESPVGTPEPSDADAVKFLTANPPARQRKSTRKSATANTPKSKSTTDKKTVSSDTDFDGRRGKGRRQLLKDLPKSRTKAALTKKLEKKKGDSPKPPSTAQLGLATKITRKLMGKEVNASKKAEAIRAAKAEAGTAGRGGAPRVAPVEDKPEPEATVTPSTSTKPKRKKKATEKKPVVTSPTPTTVSDTPVTAPASDKEPDAAKKIADTRAAVDQQNQPVVHGEGEPPKTPKVPTTDQTASAAGADGSPAPSIDDLNNMKLDDKISPDEAIRREAATSRNSGGSTAKDKEAQKAEKIKQQIDRLYSRRRIQKANEKEKEINKAWATHKGAENKDIAGEVKHDWNKIDEPLLAKKRERNRDLARKGLEIDTTTSKEVDAKNIARDVGEFNKDYDTRAKSREKVINYRTAVKAKKQKDETRAAAKAASDETKAAKAAASDERKAINAARRAANAEAAEKRREKRLEKIARRKGERAGARGVNAARRIISRATQIARAGSEVTPHAARQVQYAPSL